MMNESQALIHFSIGPVQQFIESARTTRDLWTGSYLLSWLTAKAAATALEGGGQLIPECMGEAPLVKHHHGDKDVENRDELLASCLPNTFFCVVEGNRADELGKQIKRDVEGEWNAIAASVKAGLDEKWNDLAPDWSAEWDEQIQNHWDIRVDVQPPLSQEQVDRAIVDLKLDFQSADGESDESKALRARMALMGVLSAAGKRIRHYPPHAPETDRRPKCALTGAESRMGPLNLKANNDFWGQRSVRTEDGEEEGNGPSRQASTPSAISASRIKGTRLQERDRYGAVALVKRYAWPCHFAQRFDAEARDRRMRDTATIAASGWLALKRMENGNELVARQALSGMAADIQGKWSGQWLHWSKADASKDPEDHCPRHIWDAITAARDEARRNDLKRIPPAYYAVLMLDGDGMGKLFQRLDIESANKVSNTLLKFDLEHVPGIIRDYLGLEDIDRTQPLYAGGDDVLALLPLTMPGANGNDEQTVLNCADQIRTVFHDALNNTLEASIGGARTVSAGLVVAHYKEDLRNVLEEARKAEKEAKNSGKNRLCLSIMRRSGEHSRCLMSWSDAEQLSSLVQLFAAGDITDRWAYQLRQSWDALSRNDLPANQRGDMIDAEVARLLSRSDKRQDGDKTAWNTWEQLKKFQASKPTDETPIENRQNALTLIQSASFIARGED